MMQNTCDQFVLSNLNELVDKGFTCFNIDFTDQLKEALKKLNDDLNNQNGHVEQYRSQRTGRYFNFDSVSSIIYDAVVTEHLVRLLVAYYGEHEPMVFHAVIIHTPSSANEQPIHRDSSVPELPVLTLYFDITNQIVTTEVVPFSHQADIDCVRRRPIRASHIHNAVIFHAYMAHRGVKAKCDSHKLAISFIAKPKTKVEHRLCAEHSASFGLNDNDDGLSLVTDRETYRLYAIRHQHLIKK